MDVKLDVEPAVELAVSEDTFLVVTDERELHVHDTPAVVLAVTEGEGIDR